jgi:FkbM family methyltransferase
MDVYLRLWRQINPVREAKTYFGARMKCDLRDLIPSRIFHFGVWEPDISAFIQRTLKPGDVFCDIGANVGYHTLLASSLVGPTGAVIAVEPDLSTVAKLKHNLELNNVNNTRLIRAAVAAEHGTLPFYSGPTYNTGQGTTVFAPGRIKHSDVPCLPLIDILTDRERARVKLIKIDVEGGERPILLHLIDEIDSFPASVNILVEMSRQHADDLFEKFSQKGFKAYALRNSYGVIEGYLHCTSIAEPSAIKMAPQHEQDVLFAR